MKIITYYLPQFHETLENNLWWGKGFTEWSNVKKARPLYRGHYQPRVPMNHNYYDLLNDNVMSWQVNLAKQYGIYAFCFYHYWFCGKLLLHRPVEQFLSKKSLDIKFCLCWANHEWNDSWKAGGHRILMPQLYGNRKDWQSHFNYLLPFFKDKRYLAINNAPLLIIYNPADVDCLYDMLNYWNTLALNAGFNGLCYAYQHYAFDYAFSSKDIFQYAIEYQPTCAYENVDIHSFRKRILYNLTKSNFSVLKKQVKIFVQSRFGISLKRPEHKKVVLKKYTQIWDQIIDTPPFSPKHIPGAFVDWDNTPRKENRGWLCDGATPELFEKYMTEQIKRAKKVYHKDMLFLFAWNEWAEGGYMEPDEKFGYGYLEALRNALIANGEFPQDR